MNRISWVETSNRRPGRAIRGWWANLIPERNEVLWVLQEVGVGLVLEEGAMGKGT